MKSIYVTISEPQKLISGKFLLDGDSNPGHPGLRRVYLPLYYQGKVYPTLFRSKAWLLPCLENGQIPFWKEGIFPFSSEFDNFDYFKFSKIIILHVALLVWPNLLQYWDWLFLILKILIWISYNTAFNCNSS